MSVEDDYEDYETIRSMEDSPPGMGATDSRIKRFLVLTVLMFLLPSL